MNSEMISQFQDQKSTAYRGECYCVRDNGAVLREPRKGHRRRRLDAVWSFGRQCHHSGYLLLAGIPVHRIAATAFHGPPPTRAHVVDHIDTNRRNNRAENLRWVTRLENLLLNPVTLSRILLQYGSLDAFFADPSRLSRSAQGFDWMRTVTKEEAAACRASLEAWAEQGKLPDNGRLGEWLFQPKLRRSAADSVSKPLDTRLSSATSRLVARESEHDQKSLTPSAVQRRWRTPTEFPQCPRAATRTSLNDYADRLTTGSVFARNEYGSSIAMSARVHDGILSVVSKSTQADSVKPWALALVTVEGGRFIHTGHQYFTMEGAFNEQAKLHGERPPYSPTIDDYS